MPDYEWDLPVVLGALLAFVLPITLLLPNFSVWTVVPKVQVTRFHIFAQCFNWAQLNSVIIGLIAVLFCFHLEIRTRKLDEMVERVMQVSQETEKAVEVETVKQAAAMRACVDLLDASSEHYEHLAMLRDELHRREFAAKQHPPAIETSDQDICNAQSL